MKPIGCCVAAGLLIVSMPSSVLIADESVSYARDIRPVFSDACFACHGPDEEKREADLRLDVAEMARESGSVVPGKPDESDLYRRIMSDAVDTRMPPEDFHKELTDAEKDLIRRWIESGANYEEHWSFVVPKRPDVPSGNQKNPIDAFIQRRLATERLQSSPVADRRTLIRRVTLDLTGLPPTKQEIDEFLADDSADAYAKLIDRLVSRITYGEHMARYWLDLARYADTHGLHLDNERSIWPYRDWVVRAFHENVTFDDFTRWQLAGDLLPNPTRDQLIASGFNRCNVSTSEGGSINDEWIFRYAVDRTATAAEVWMGLTAGCAVCHDHKFDPISTKDFYSMYAFFHSAADPAMDGNKIDTPPILKLYSEEDEKKIAAIDQQLAQLDEQAKSMLAETSYEDPASTKPNPELIQTVWMEDAFPDGAKLERSGEPEIRFIESADGPVFSGNRAVQRSGAGITQDFYSSGAQPLSVPKAGKIFAYCFLDPDDPPETVMLQFNVGGNWNHRAVWGAEAKIPWGTAGKPDKIIMGDLPETGSWQRLVVDAAKMGLKSGTKVDGFALTQFDGTVTWDKVGVESSIDKASDPEWSWQVWTKQKAGKRNNELPEGLRQLVRAKQAEKWTDDEHKRVFDHWFEHVFAGSQELLSGVKAERTKLSDQKTEIEKGVPFTFVMADLPKPRESFVMIRGAYDKPGEKVVRNVPAFLPGLPEKPSDKDYDRLDLANWLVSGEHPLTARVAANRFWQQFFGTGLVATSGDFGSQGEPPTHPELLDWLAVEFVESGWDVKKLVKLIMTSHTYRQTSAASPDLIEKDPQNRLLARGPRLRLDAEVLRDQALFVSGLLVPTIGGKSVKPYQPPNIWEPVGFGSSNTRYYKQDSGDSLYRRSLYTFLKRTAPPPFMSTFDAPNREQSCTRRARSNTPMQALQLMNDVQHIEAARHLATQMIKEAGETTNDRIVWAFERVTARKPVSEEVEIIHGMLDQFQKRYKKDVEAAKKLIEYGDSPSDDSIESDLLAAYTMTANLLLNLDEVVAKN